VPLAWGVSLDSGRLLAAPDGNGPSKWLLLLLCRVNSNRIGIRVDRGSCCSPRSCAPAPCATGPACQMKSSAFWAGTVCCVHRVALLLEGGVVTPWGSMGKCTAQVFSSNETERVELQGASSAAASSASTIVARQDAALARLPADFKAVVDLLERSLPPPRPFSEQPSKLREARNAPELVQRIPKAQHAVDVRLPTSGVRRIESACLVCGATYARRCFRRSLDLRFLRCRPSQRAFHSLLSLRLTLRSHFQFRGVYRSSLALYPVMISQRESTRGVARLPGDTLARVNLVTTRPITYSSSGWWLFRGKCSSPATPSLAETKRRGSTHPAPRGLP